MLQERACDSGMKLLSILRYTTLLATKGTLPWFRMCTVYKAICGSSINTGSASHPKHQVVTPHACVPLTIRPPGKAERDENSAPSQLCDFI